MKPIVHAKLSAKKYGGSPEDYMPIHEFMDSSKSALPDVRHRAILHSAFGCFVVERVFGSVASNSEGKDYCPRDVAEDHCLEDLGTIPTLEKWLSKLPIESWMGRPDPKAAEDKPLRFPDHPVMPTWPIMFDGHGARIPLPGDDLNRVIVKD